MSRIVLVENLSSSGCLAMEMVGAAHDVVRSCSDTIASFEMVRQSQPDLIILNLVAGGHRTGCRLLDQLKRQHETHAIPVLLPSDAAPTLAQNASALEERGVYLLEAQASPARLAERAEQALRCATPGSTGRRAATRSAARQSAGA